MLSPINTECPEAPLVSYQAACLLCFIENFLPASPAAGEGGRRGGATQIQRLICLLVKRSSRLHFLMRALIKSGGVWQRKDKISAKPIERPSQSKAANNPKLQSTISEKWAGGEVKKKKNAPKHNKKRGMTPPSSLQFHSSAR